MNMIQVSLPRTRRRRRIMRQVISFQSYTTIDYSHISVIESVAPQHTQLTYFTLRVTYTISSVPTKSENSLDAYRPNFSWSAALMDFNNFPHMRCCKPIASFSVVDCLSGSQYPTLWSSSSVLVRALSALLRVLVNRFIQFSFLLPSHERKRRKPTDVSQLHKGNLQDLITRSRQKVVSDWL